MVKGSSLVWGFESCPGCDRLGIDQENKIPLLLRCCSKRTHCSPDLHSMQIPVWIWRYADWPLKSPLIPALLSVTEGTTVGEQTLWGQTTVEGSAVAVYRLRRLDHDDCKLLLVPKKTKYDFSVVFLFLQTTFSEISKKKRHQQKSP